MKLEQLVLDLAPPARTPPSSPAAPAPAPSPSAVGSPPWSVGASTIVGACPLLGAGGVAASPSSPADGGHPSEGRIVPSASLEGDVYSEAWRRIDASIERLRALPSAAGRGGRRDSTPFARSALRSLGLRSLDETGYVAASMLEGVVHEDREALRAAQAALSTEQEAVATLRVEAGSLRDRAETAERERASIAQVLRSCRERYSALQRRLDAVEEGQHEPYEPRRQPSPRTSPRQPSSSPRGDAGQAPTAPDADEGVGLGLGALGLELPFEESGGATAAAAAREEARLLAALCDDPDVGS